MPMPTINISLSSLPPYECGAILFTYLAFPEPAVEEDRGRIHAALCHLALRAISQDDPSGQWAPQIIKPGYALLSESDVRNALRTMDRRLADRRQAAIVAKPFLEQATTGQVPRLPPGVDQLSVENMAEYLLLRSSPSPDKAEVKNFHGRVWRPSLPVIHLALALNMLFEHTRTAGLEKLAVHDLIRSPEAIEFLSKTAELLELIFLQITKLGINDATLLKFRLT